MKQGDYVKCRKFPQIHGEVAEVGDPLVTIKLPDSRTQQFFPSHLEPFDRPEMFALSSSGLGADVDNWARGFWQQHKGGTKLNDLWKGGSGRQFLGFCEFLKAVNIP